EEALTHLNWCTSNGKRLLVNVDLAQNGWVFTGTNYAKTRSLTDSYYTVNISSTINPVILCSGYVKAPLGTNYVCRTVQVMAHNAPLYSKALAAKGRIVLNGSKLTV